MLTSRFINFNFSYEPSFCTEINGKKIGILYAVKSRIMNIYNRQFKLNQEYDKV